MIEKLADDYPSGDMRGDALFRAALHRIVSGDWDGAIPWLDRIVAADPNDRHWATAGRAAYFRARAAQQKGDRDAAIAGY
ncbi:tetratricopeptide repeat protein, partial [Vibrio parahaemolyticus]